MAKQNPPFSRHAPQIPSEQRHSGPFGSTVLVTLCAGGALVWAFVAGASLMTPEAPGPDAPAGELDTVAGSSPDLPDAPIGKLRIQVSSEAHAYIQNLTCTGNSDVDPGLCMELASIAAEQEAEEDEFAGLFAEVPAGAVCDTDRAYGPGEARVVGEWEGEEVDADLDRSDSCEEVRWQRLTPLTDPME